MPSSRSIAAIGVLMLAPALCCFIGVGVLVHLGLPIVHAESRRQQDRAEEATELQERLASHQRQNRKADEELAREKERLAALEVELAAEQQRVEQAKQEAGRAEDELAAWEDKLRTLRERLASLRQQLALEESSPEGHDGGSPIELHPLLHPFLTDALDEDAADLDRSREEKEAELRRAEAERARLEAKRRAIEQELADAQKTYAVTSLLGGNASRARDAVFAECTADALILQPEETRLGPALTEADQRAFLARLRDPRYVVFLIRPDGLGTFRRYRNLVLSENRTGSEQIDIGFEPVNADWALVYPEGKG
jgi:predicted nuclease with TOPRIM domain